MNKCVFVTSGELAGESVEILGDPLFNLISFKYNYLSKTLYLKIILCCWTAFFFLWNQHFTAECERQLFLFCCDLDFHNMLNNLSCLWYLSDSFQMVMMEVNCYRYPLSLHPWRRTLLCWYCRMRMVQIKLERGKTQKNYKACGEKLSINKFCYFEWKKKTRSWKVSYLENTPKNYYVFCCLKLKTVLVLGTSNRDVML